MSQNHNSKKPYPVKPSSQTTTPHSSQPLNPSQPELPPLNPNLSKSTPNLDLKTPLPGPELNQTPPLDPSTPGLEKSGRKTATSRLDKLTAQLTGFYAAIGMMVTRADMYDGLLLMKESENRAKELIAVASHHKGMLNILEKLVESNDYITLTIGHGMMIYAMLAHHKRLKGDAFMLAQFGYSEQQVLGPMYQPSEEESQNGHVASFEPALSN